MKDYKLIIFDWDGTLVDSIERIVTSLQHASREVCRLHVSEDVARSVIGLGLFEAIEKLHPELESVKIESIAAAYNQHFFMTILFPRTCLMALKTCSGNWLMTAIPWP